MKISETYSAPGPGTMVFAALLAAACLGLASCDSGANVQPVATTLCCDPLARPGVGMVPSCIEGATCCGDGSWQCNQATGDNTCQEYDGLCEITECDLDDEPGVGDNPACFEGATCCPDGQWHCNSFGGTPNCG